jgi:hypothetical protein
MFLAREETFNIQRSTSKEWGTDFSRRYIPTLDPVIWIGFVQSLPGLFFAEDVLMPFAQDLHEDSIRARTDYFDMAN